MYSLAILIKYILKENKVLTALINNIDMINNIFSPI